MPAIQKAQISFAFPEEMKNKLLELAEKERRSLSGYLRLVLQDHLQAIEASEPKTKQKTVIRRKNSTKKGK